MDKKGGVTEEKHFSPPTPTTTPQVPLPHSQISFSRLLTRQSKNEFVFNFLFERKSKADKLIGMKGETSLTSINYDSLNEIRILDDAFPKQKVIRGQRHPFARRMQKRTVKFVDFRAGSIDLEDAVEMLRIEHVLLRETKKTFLIII